MTIARRIWYEEFVSDFSFSIIIGKVFTKKLAGVVKKRTIAMIKALCKYRMYCSAASQ